MGLYSSKSVEVSKPNYTWRLTVDVSERIQYVMDSEDSKFVNKYVGDEPEKRLTFKVDVVSKQMFLKTGESTSNAGDDGDLEVLNSQLVKIVSFLKMETSESPSKFILEITPDVQVADITYTITSSNTCYTKRVGTSVVFDVMPKTGDMFVIMDESRSPAGTDGNLAQMKTVLEHILSTSFALFNFEKVEKVEETKVEEVSIPSESLEVPESAASSE